MIRKTTIANLRAAFCQLIAVVLLLSSTSSAFARPTPTFGDDPPFPVYDMTPSTGSPGREYTILILKHDSANPKIDDKTRLVPPGELTVSGVKATSKLSLTAKISVPRDAPVGKYRFLLKDKEGTDAAIIGTADFEVTAIGLGPIPPGIDPQVDVMWGVMPTDIVHHNFGRQIAKHYYGIQIRIGNDSGYDLQIAGIGFKLPDGGIRNTVPTNSYRATRGTLEREQQIGLRATVMNVIKALSGLYSGFLPFWHMPNRRANANLAGQILSGPFQTGS